MLHFTLDAEVKVWKIASVEATTGQPAKIIKPHLVPTHAEIEDYLNEVFKNQLNAEIAVTMSPVAADQYHEIEWDISDPFDYDPNANPAVQHDVSVHDAILNLMGTASPMGADRPSPEAWLIHRNLGMLDDSTNIHVYLVAADRIAFVTPKNHQVISDTENGTSLQGVTFRSDRMCFIASKRRSPTDGAGPGAVLRGRTTGVITHEIGHVFVGEGHPDKYPHFKDPNIVGPAPLPGTKHRDRLMHSGVVNGKGLLLNFEDYGKLLVKAEWDEGEAWMKQEESEGRITP